MMDRYRCLFLTNLSEKIENTVELQFDDYGNSRDFLSDGMFGLTIHNNNGAGLIFTMYEIIYDDDVNMHNTNANYYKCEFNITLTDNLVAYHGANDYETYDEYITLQFTLTDESNCDDIFTREIEPTLQLFLDAFKKM